MSYAYGDRIVWIDDLHADGHPMTHDLCRLHAETMRMPRGWTLKDRRVAAEIDDLQFRRFAG